MGQGAGFIENVMVRSEELQVLNFPQNINELLGPQVFREMLILPQ
jgi:hypothetical protein